MVIFVGLDNPIQDQPV